jgi:hypothetical protein
MADFQIRPVITDIARTNLGSMLDLGYPAFQVTDFAVGIGGYSPQNPTIALPPDPSTDLINEIFRSSNVARENLDQFSKVYIGTLQQAEGVGELGEVALIATYLSGPLQGQKFTLGKANFPMKVKTTQDIFRFLMVVLL